MIPFSAGLLARDSSHGLIASWLRGSSACKEEIFSLIEELERGYQCEDVTEVFCYLLLLCYQSEEKEIKRRLVLIAERLFLFVPKSRLDIQLIYHHLFFLCEEKQTLQPMLSLTTTDLLGDVKLALIAGLITCDRKENSVYFFERVAKISALFDEEGVLFSLWNKAHERDLLLAHIWALFEIKEKLIPSIKGRTLLSKITDALKQSKEGKLPLLAAIAKGRSQSKETFPSFYPSYKKRSFAEFPACISTDSKGEVAAATLLPPSMGLFHKKAVKLRAFGPHEEPLGDIENFGTEGFFLGKEVLGSDFSLSGWTKSRSARGLFGKRFFSSMRFSQGMWKIDLEADELLPAYFVFFVEAKLAFERENQLFFQSEKQQIMIETEEKQAIILTPVSKDYYGANFLLAYSLKEKTKISFTIQ